MADGTIDSISIEVTSGADEAVRQLSKLSQSLSTLESRLGRSAARAIEFSSALAQVARAARDIDAKGLKELAGVSLKGTLGSSFSRNIVDTAAALELMPAGASQRLQAIAAACRGFDAVKMSVTLPKNLGVLAQSLGAMPEGAAQTLASIGTALQGFGGASLSKSTVNALSMLPEVMQKFGEVDTAGFVSAISELNPQVKELAANVDLLQEAVNKLPPSYRTLGKAAATVTSANKKLAAANEQLATSEDKAATAGQRLAGALDSIPGGIASIIAKVGALTAAWHTMSGLFKATIGAANTFIEDTNLFGVAMGDAAGEAYRFASAVQDLMGIDLDDWMKYQGTFQMIAEGFGIANDRAAVMSRNLVQLGYDLSSLHDNLGVDQAMLKLESGLAGEIEPLRRIGYDLSNAAMQVAATNLGLEKQVSDMDQAEKAALRYYMVMQATSNVQGDMARTLNSPANQLRILKAQFQQTARAVGNLFIPVLNKILPVVIGVVKALRLLAQAIARVFHVDVNFDVDWSQFGGGGGYDTGGIDDTADAFDDAGKAAGKAAKKAKEYQNTVMGFDELNKLNPTPEDSGGSGGGGSGGGGLGGAGGSVLDAIPLDTYDFLSGLETTINDITDQIANRMLPVIMSVGAGLAGWMVASALGGDLNQCLGTALALGGAVYYVYNWLDAWNNGITLDNLDGMLLGTAGIVAGLYLAFGQLAGAVGAVAAGLGLVVVGIKDVLENGMNMENYSTILWGISLAVAGLYVAVGPLAAAFGLLAGGVALVVLSFIDFKRNGPTEANTRGMVIGIMLVAGAFAALFGWPALIVGAVVAGVAAIAMNWDTLKEKLPQPVQDGIDAVVGFFRDLPGNVMGFFGDLKKGWDDFWGGLFGGAEESTDQGTGHIAAKNISCKATVLDAWRKAKPALTKAWGGIKTAAKTAWGKIKETVGGRVDEMRAAVSEKWSDIKDRVSEWNEGIRRDASEKWESVKTQVGSKVDSLKTTVSNKVTLIKTTLGTKWSEIRSAASTAWDGLKTTVGTKFEETREKVATTAGSIRTTLSERWENVKSAASSAWDSVKTTAGSKWSDIKGAVSTKATETKTSLDTAWTNAKSAASTAWDNIKTTASTKWSDIKTAVGSKATEIKTHLGTTWDNVKTVAGTAWDSVKSTASTKWEQVKGTVTTAATNIRTGVGTQWDNLKTAASGAWDSVKSAASTKWGNVKTTVTDAAGNIKTQLDTKWGNVKSAAGTAWDNVKTDASSKWTAIKTTITGVVDGIKTAVTNCKPKFASIAAPVIGKVDTAVNAIKTAVTNCKPKFASIAAPVIGSVSSAITSIKNQISGFKAPSWPKITGPKIGAGTVQKPHFTWSWQTLMKTPLVKIPKVSVSWYAKGGVFDQASLIGIGEAGREAALPLNRNTYGEIANGITSEMRHGIARSRVYDAREDARGGKWSGTPVARVEFDERLGAQMETAVTNGVIRGLAMGGGAQSDGPSVEVPVYLDRREVARGVYRGLQDLARAREIPMEVV